MLPRIAAVAPGAAAPAAAAAFVFRQVVEYPAVPAPLAEALDAALAAHGAAAAEDAATGPAVYQLAGTYTRPLSGST